jgi:hypothetical protein
MGGYGHSRLGEFVLGGCDPQHSPLDDRAGIDVSLSGSAN